MNELIARRYVRAMIELLKTDELKEIIKSLDALDIMYEMDKFQLIINSPDVSKNEKMDIVLSAVGDKNIKLINLIKLLNENDRLSLIPHIKNELKVQVLQMDNVHKGIVRSNFDIQKSDLDKLQKSFSKKFGGVVELESKKSDYPGIKIELETLGVEASFSIERLKAQMVEHILKAI